MQKIIAASLLLATCVCTGCATKSENEISSTINQTEENVTETESVNINDAYTLHGRYYLDGFFIDENGEVWKYFTTEIDNKPVYDGMPIYAILWNNGTAEITDDEIGLVGIDYYTELMDELY